MTFRALVLEQSDDGVSSSLQELDDDRLPDGAVTVGVEYSSLNYKDGMILRGQGRLVREYPHVPGIDLAGVVEASNDDAFAPGDRVVLTGWRVGEAHWGGYATRAARRAAVAHAAAGDAHDRGGDARRDRGLHRDARDRRARTARHRPE